MQVGVIGVNFKTAPLEIRETLSRVQTLSPGCAWVHLSTCNRMEIYFSSNNLASTQTNFLNLLREDIVTEFEPYLYSYFGYDCFAHLAKVVSGFDSALIGESEIQRQVKVAYGKSKHLCKELHYLFQKSLFIGKRMRTQFTLPHNRDLKSIAGEIIRLFFPQADRILLIGNSMINRQIYYMLRHRGIKNITLCSRYETDLETGLLPWNERERWSEYPITVCAAKDVNYLITSGAPKERRLILDLGIPRNVDPQIGRNPHVRLFNIDELTAMHKNHIPLELCSVAMEELTERLYTRFMQKKIIPLAMEA
ncbi:MAG: hypothetical protein MRY21_04665 [Simkaniaceae bacterium]|nr:hypothetical protein [Simkaniaceae bacterium]